MGGLMKTTTMNPIHPEPLITTKLAPPRRARHTLARPRLERLFQQIADTTLALVKAPPGFGKTTLITAWADVARASGASVAWLSLDEHDDDVERLLLLYMTAAVKRALQAPSATLQDLALLPREQLISQLLQELEQCGAPATCSSTTATACRRPAGSRRRPADPLRTGEPAPDSLRAQRPACLAEPVAVWRCRRATGRSAVASPWRKPASCSPAATARPCRTAMSMPCNSPPTAGSLGCARLLVMRQTPDAPMPAGQGVSDVFDNLLAQLPVPLLEQLLPLSVVEQFNAALASELGSGCGKTLILQLEQQQLFVNALDESGTWYGLHPLFREHLQRHLRLRPDAEQQALMRAAQWFAAQQLWAHAVRCALAAGQEQDALRWIAECAMTLVEHGDFIQLLDWQRRLHDRLLEAPAQLQLALAWAFGLAMLERPLATTDRGHSP
jgi:LuxR family maltose regulon positive regulatory protein